MEWAKPPPMPLIDMRFGHVQSNRRSAAHVKEGFVSPPPSSFQLATATEESAATLGIQETVRRFLQQVYIPSGQYLGSETDLPANVKTVMNYYAYYFVTRSVFNTWSEKYTGEVKTTELDSLPAKTGWDQAYKYYRWNFTNPQQCALPPSSSPLSLGKSVPNFDFGLNVLGVEKIRTYAEAVEGFQSIINTGEVRVKMVNQQFKNGVLMIRFDEPAQFDGYSWNKKANINLLLDPPEGGWVIQGSNDDSVWSSGIDAQAYRDNLQLDSPKWTTLHAVGDAVTIPGTSTVPKSDYGSSGKVFKNLSKTTFIQHLQQATQSMVAAYIEEFRKTFVSLPASMQSQLAVCYQDVERDKADAKDVGATPDKMDGLIQKYVYASNTFSNPTDISGVALDVPGAIASTSTYYGPIFIPAGSPITPGMRVTVTQGALAPVKQFKGTVSDYNKATGQLRLNNLDVTGLVSADGASFGTARLNIIAFQYDTQTVNTVVLDPTMAQLTFKVGSNLSYTSNNSVRVSQTANAANSFDAVVSSYDRTSGDMIVGNITNVQGTFTASTKYTVKPQQASCLAKLRDVVKQDLASNIRKIFAFVSSCKDNAREGATVSVSPATATVTYNSLSPSPSPSVATVTLNETTDLATLLTSNNLREILDMYKKYNDTYTRLIRTKLLEPTGAGEAEAVLPQELALFEEPQSLTGTYSLPNTLFRQMQRLVNAKMRQFYTEYYYDTEGTVSVPANFTAYYEPAIKGIFNIDPVKGTSEIGGDYNMLWTLKPAEKYPDPTDPTGEKYTGQEYIFYLNKKYDGYLKYLGENKTLAAARGKAIKMIELFEDYYGRVSEIMVTLSMKVPGKAARDRDRLVVAANSTSQVELDALYEKYYDYLYTNKIMDKYTEVDNDLWSCAKRAIEEQLTFFDVSYGTTDPTPTSQQVLNVWKRPGVTKTYFTELEEEYVGSGVITAEQRPSKVFADMSETPSIEDAMNTAINALTTKKVNKKPEAGGSSENAANYRDNLEKIQALQDIYIRIYNAREILEPFKEANKPLGMIQRTRDAMQVGVVQQRVQKVVDKYKELYKAYVDISGSDGRWDTLYTKSVTDSEGTLYNVTKPIPPPTHSNYALDLSTIGGFGVTEAILLGIENNYTKADGHFKNLQDYVKILGSNLTTACDLMKKWYDSKYDELAGETYKKDGAAEGTDNWGLSGKVAFVFNDEKGYYTALNFKFGNDAERQGTFDAIDALLGTNNVGRIITIYNDCVSRITAYNEEVIYLGKVFDKVYTEYQNIGELITKTTQTLDMNGITEWNDSGKTWTIATGVTVGLENNGKLVSSFTASTKPDKPKTIKGCVDIIRGTLTSNINSALATAYTRLNALLGDIKKFKTDNNGKLWYTFISEPLRNYINTVAGLTAFITSADGLVNLTPSSWTVKENFFALYRRTEATFVDGKSSSDVYQFTRKKVMKTFSIAYSVITKVRSEMVAIKPEKKLVFKSETASDAGGVKSYNLSGRVGTEIDITADISGYRTLDYLLVGGGGGGAGAQGVGDNHGGGGGGSGHFRASQEGSVFGYPNATNASGVTVYNSKLWKDNNTTGKTKLDTITISDGNKYFIKIGSGGAGGISRDKDENGDLGSEGGGSTLIIKDNSNITIFNTVAEGGSGGGDANDFVFVDNWGNYYYTAVYPNNPENPPIDGDWYPRLWKGGSGANNGGDGAADEQVQNAGGNLFGGESKTICIDPANGCKATEGTDCTGGSGGGGIGGGLGGTGAITDFNTPAVAGANYTGAGGGGGADSDNQLPHNGANGGHGYAILLLNYGINMTTDGKTADFITCYSTNPAPSCPAGFQNQFPATPQLQQRILTQKLNALRFNATPQPPTILHSIQSLLTSFTSFFG